MPYTYKYIPAQQPISFPPKESMTNDFGALLETYFYESTDWYTIQEETAFASGVYQNTDARITSLIDPTSGDNVEDDWKKFTFRELTHDLSLGRMYIFNSNYWLTINVDTIKTLAQTAVVRRCNNTLRWIDLDGGLNELPCAIQYIIKENRDYATAGSAIVVPSGVMQCFVQFNSTSNKIQKNQRFLFGNSQNWTAYKVEAGGINNFNNLQTADNNSCGFIRLTLVADYVNKDVDNLTLGIADYYNNAYIVTVTPTTASGDISQTIQLYSEVTLNGQTVSRNVLWTSSDVTIATVDATGLVTLIAEGSAVITATLENNAGIHGSSTITVVATPQDTPYVLVTPVQNYILEGATQQWEFQLYINNVLQPDTFTFTLNPRSVPSDNYTYTVLDGHTFEIKNKKMFLTDYLEVFGTTGTYDSTIQINLKGAW